MTYNGRWEANMVIPAGGAAMSATNGAGGPTTCTVPAGTYGPSSLVAAVVAALIASRPPSTGTWTGSLSVGPTGTGKVTLNCTQTTGTWSISWTSTVLRDVLGFPANIVAVAAAQTGTKCARGLWQPDCPMGLDGDPAQAPRDSDYRATISPAGAVYSMAGNTLYRHTNVQYANVPYASAWEAAATAAGKPNASWETFFNDVQLGLGSIPWFTAGGSVQIFDHNGVQVGINANAGAGLATGWNFPDVTSTSKVTKSQGQWIGTWLVNIGQLVSSG